VKEINMRGTFGSVTNAEYMLLRSVPLRGTEAWDARERLRRRLGASLLSYGPLDIDAFLASGVKERVRNG
jgi:hypothetical protein